MPLLDALDQRHDRFIHYLNTGTLADLVTGRFYPGMNGSAILNGGLAYTNSASGRPRMYKSTFAESLIIRAMAIYSGTEALVNDTEFALLKDRILGFNNSPLLPKPTDLGMRFALTDKTSDKSNAEPFFEQIKAACSYKEENKKDLIVESPFLDPKTGKPHRMWIPTIIGIDSITKLMSNKVIEMYEKNDVGSSGVNMTFMNDGGIKSRIVSQLPSLAAKYGIYFILTAHIGNKYSLDGAPVSKDLQYSKQGDTLKGVGADFNFLMSNSFEMRKTTLLQEDKECLYPDKYSAPTELTNVDIVVTGNKHNMSGGVMPLIVSQQSGVLSDLTNYHYLKGHKYAGMLGNNRFHQNALLPDVKLERTSIRSKLESYELCRAFELIAQYHFIQNYWTLRDFPIDFTLPVEKFAEQLLANKTYAVQELLQSRGYWTYNKADPRFYMSIWDTVAMLQGKFSPKLKTK